MSKEAEQLKKQRIKLLSEIYKKNQNSKYKTELIPELQKSKTDPISNCSSLEDIDEENISNLKKTKTENYNGAKKESSKASKFDSFGLSDT